METSDVFKATTALHIMFYRTSFCGIFHSPDILPDSRLRSKNTSTTLGIEQRQARSTVSTIAEELRLCLFRIGLLAAV
jgi:hypothetical protein